ncbi:hypothetical protein LJC17_03235 [Acholeplasma sp. OttesenSCG-928-E16]|nr:hypothetical protein [Acholeplasma sp. OttesenSCG-928-E16]
MRVFRGIWRVIRWIIYLVLLLALPIAITFGVGWIKNGDESFAVQLKTDLIKLNYNVTLVKVTTFGEEKIDYINCDDETSIMLFDISGFGVSYYQGEGDLSKVKVVTTSLPPNSNVIDKDNILSVEATFLVGGSLIIYIVLLILMLVHIKKRGKNENSQNQIAAARESISSPNDLEINLKEEIEVSEEVVAVDENEEKKYDDDLFEPISDEQNIDEPEEKISFNDEDIFHEEEKGLIISREENKEKIESYKYVDEVNKAKEKENLVEIETKWCKILAEQGDKEAQYALAVYYANGYKDVERSEILSQYWLRKAADNGHEKAIEILKENE